MSQAQEGTGPGSARQGARAGGQCAKDSATARGKKINLIIAVARAGEGQQIPRPSPMVPSWHKKKKRAGSELGRGFEVKSPIGRRSSRDQSDRVKPRSLIVLRPPCPTPRARCLRSKSPTTLVKGANALAAQHRLACVEEATVLRSVRCWCSLHHQPCSHYHSWHRYHLGNGARNAAKRERLKCSQLSVQIREKFLAARAPGAVAKFIATIGFLELPTKSGGKRDRNWLHRHCGH
jgi:hypothetical protein